MSSETFAYDTATSTSILSQVSSANDFLKTPTQELRTRDYEKEKRKLISYDLHCITLAEYHKQGKIPRGLRCSLRPTLFSDNQDFCEKYKRILNKCSLDIIILTIKFLQKSIVETQENIKAIETQLTSTLSSAEWTKLKEKTDKVFTDHQKFLQERKRLKFQRDNDDYASNRVYKWSDSTWQGNWRRQPYQRRSFSTDSDSSTNSNRSQGRLPTHRPMRRSRRKNDNSLPGKTPNLVINTSSYTLSPAELALLQKGLSFCPTPNWDAFQLERDLQRFYRTVRLKTHFGTLSETSESRVSPSGDVSVADISLASLGLRNPSTFSPPQSFHATETFISFVDHEDNKSIIIKPADKGVAIVIMNRTMYSNEVQRQLSDSNTYRAILRDPTFDIERKIRNLIRTYSPSYLLRTYLDNHTIDQNTAKFLSNSNPVIPVFYILPKVHKSLTNPPGRPIVASTDSILSPLSIYLEKILTPLVRTTKSFLLDTGHFLSLIREHDTIPSDSLLVTIDVNSLYTYISHEKGITATRTLLQASNMPRNSIKFCLDLLKLVLYENFFSYEDTYYV
ncbi:unnamed protein product [Ranitomeya imitator]|uniref:Reverse transcriptase domain-containing protein n=1 Tax=Ranitomeya imitator TaxID=111125 RepID=A0ABN9M2B4_9NEOB|nr:unnamed protein product [Ranitomeya imitator]